MKYEKHLVAFIDILGFKELVNESEKEPKRVEELLKILNDLKKLENTDKWNLKFIEIEESAQYKGVDSFDISKRTNVTSFSDSIVISVKVEDQVNEYFSSLVANLSYYGAQLLEQGILLRGSITLGDLIHQSGIVFGKGMIEAYLLESKSAKFPRIILSKKLLNELNYPLLRKPERYPYHQYIQRFEDGCVGFHQMIHYTVIQSWPGLSSKDLKAKLNTVRLTIINGLNTNFELIDVFEKYKWLAKMYQELIILDPCELEQDYPLEIKEPIYGFRSQNIHFTDEY